MSDTLTDERVETTPTTTPTDTGDHDLFAHYVTKKALELALFNGVPTKALCGKVWLPTKDAQRFPVCPECKEKFDALPEDEG